MDEARMRAAEAYALRGGGSGCVFQGDETVWAWGDQNTQYDLYSTTKSIGVTALGLALADGKVKLDDRARDHLDFMGVPPESNGETGWLEEITLFHLATHTAGFEKTRGWCALQFRAGTGWLYSDGGANWLADCLTAVYGRDLLDVMRERVFDPLEITIGEERFGAEDLWWGFNGLDRERQIDGIDRRPMGAGIFANVRAMARIGLLYLAGGRVSGLEIIPEWFVDRARVPAEGLTELPVVADEKNRFKGAARHYGLLWWNNGDGALSGVPTDAYWAWGLKESLIVVVPSLDLVIARAGEGGWQDDEWGSRYEVIAPFMQAVCEAAE